VEQAESESVVLFMMKPQRKIQRGFTMIELIVTMILIGILSAVAIPRMNLISGFDEVGYRDQVIATLEFARKSAVAARRYVCVNRGLTNTLTLTIDTAIPESGSAVNCPAAHLNLPGTNSNGISPRGSTTLGGLSRVVFDPLGRATLTGGASLTVSGDSVVTLTVDSGTGYVY
jgi:MSHA pilin protein MshC